MYSLTLGIAALRLSLLLNKVVRAQLKVEGAALRELNLDLWGCVVCV